MTNRHTRSRSINNRTIAASRPFKRGATDYCKGLWSDVTGTWRGVDMGIVYEMGRLTAALATSRGEPVSANLLWSAIQSGDIPMPSRAH